MTKRKGKERKQEQVHRMKDCRRVRRADGLQMKTVKGYTFPDFLEAISSRYPKRTCYRVFRQGEENDMTYSQLKWHSYAVSSYLLSIGVSKGDRIAILGESSPTWMVMYLGIVSIGAVAVPILPDFPERDVLSILRESGASGIAVNAKQHQKIANAEAMHVFRLDDLVHIPSDASFDSFSTAPGYAMRSARIDRKALEATRPSEDDLASIIFTSGTTGASKGVMLTHMNILRTADLATDVYVKLKPGMKVLSILPMSHVYEFTIGQVLPLMVGLEITFLGKQPAVSILMPALSEVRPHVMLTVPLLIEKVYKAAVIPALRDNEKIRKLIGNPLLSPFVYMTIGKRLKKTFGHRLVFFGIGGAPLDREVELFLHKAHFPYALGYGLTETSPLVAGCGSAHRRQHPGFVGEIVTDDRIILLDKNDEGIGEIAVRGPNVMKGYYQRPDLNSEAFTPDGYFRTGDLGFIDKYNRLSIRGRVKTMILGPGGENIYPEMIETLINNQDFVQESLVVPENGGLVALIKLDVDLMAEKMSLSIKEAREEAQKYIKKIRNDVNSELSAFSKISDVQLQEEPFDRTPTQKIKRFLYPKKKKDGDSGRGEKDD